MSNFLRAAAMFLLLINSRSAPAEPSVELLWPQGAPGAKGEAEADKPKLMVHPADPATANGAAIVVCPGGGYGGLAMDHEGKQIVDWLNSQGITALVCDYRHRGKGYGHPAPLQDAQRAIRTARARAPEWKTRPDRIGILGFSAGGHLASSAGTHFDAGNPSTADPIERVSCRPDFLVLCYPVISLTSSCTHQGSKRNLLGESPDARLVESLSNELQVTAQTPPTFLFHTTADAPVPPENSLLFYAALVKAGVPAELHIYERGPHGVGLAKTIPGTGDWPDRCIQWLRGRGMLDKK
jgi:acetyl esterase/lipase